MDAERAVLDRRSGGATARTAPRPATGHPLPGAAHAALALQRSAGNRATTALIGRAAPVSAVVVVARQITDGDRSGPRDGCFDLLSEIIRLLEEVADRFRQAQEDRHRLFDFHRRAQDSHPEHGSWDGHREAYERRRQDLRRKLERWDNDDDCRMRRLSTAEQDELSDAREYAGREFPARPVPSMREAHAPGSDLEAEVRRGLIEVGVPAFAVGALVVLVIAALADPEPLTKLALILGTATAVALLVLFGREEDVPPGAMAAGGAPGPADGAATAVA